MFTTRIKLLTCSAIIGLLTLPAFHANAGVDGSPFEGLYLGIPFTKSTFDSSASYTQINTTETTRFNGISSKTSKNSWGGGLVGGYGLNYGAFYVGAEAAFIVDKGNTIISDGTNTFKLSKSNTFDVNLRGGLTLSDKALLFALVGYSGVSLKSEGVNSHLDNTEDKFSKRITGFKFGGGVEIGIVENIALRLDYTRTTLNTTTITHDADQFTFKPKTSRIMMSVILHMY